MFYVGRLWFDREGDKKEETVVTKQQFERKEDYFQLYDTGLLYIVKIFMRYLQVVLIHWLFILSQE